MAVPQDGHALVPGAKLTITITITIHLHFNYASLALYDSVIFNLPNCAAFRCGFSFVIGREFSFISLLLSRYAGITCSAFISRECKSQIALSNTCFLLFITLAFLIFPSELFTSSIIIPFGHSGNDLVFVEYLKTRILGFQSIHHLNFWRISLLSFSS